MRFSLALSAYMAFSARATRYAEKKLSARLDAGKEDPDRIGERRGIAGMERPEGDLIWFHAASVGESLSLLELIRRMSEERPDLHFLVTTGTVTSAQVMAARLPSAAFHQFIPVDALPYVRRFLDHWRPNLAVWTESELWPALIVETKARSIPMVIINARMSKTSHDRWRFLRGMVRRLLEQFDEAHVQDDLTASYLRHLGLPGERLHVTGTLKEGAAALPCDETLRAKLARHLNGRPTWLAASTHEGEEQKILDAHKQALKVNPRLLLVLVPRHPHRGDDIATLIEAQGFSFARRSAGEQPDPDIAVYLADTLGELGLWYRLAPISFVGGSLEPIGGHNPFEPAALGSVILHGPYVSNFVDIFQRLAEAKASRLVSSPDTLAAAVNDLLNPDRAADMAHAAWEVCSAGAEVTDKALDMLFDHLDRTPRLTAD
jgi:3-deoxy-D-manno-octulosonic-acid transferase